ncbi:unnamed protein product [Owenia fusiformis]|uniref:Uncharacterized protein n=2 Tax=Owenia fusiformis TaxID=6347 RepID=A0A8J1YCD2_OWEFU|nr:unnamed protein product [Owenia fusiformis]
MQTKRIRRESAPYTNASSPTGRCLIINNFDFYPRMPNRYGTVHDVDRLKRVFTRFKYIVCVKNDLTAGAIRKTLTEESTQDHADSFVLVILSHGAVDAVYGVDGKTVPYKEIYNYFNGENCKKLAGKPKIIIFQACQSSREDDGVTSHERSVDCSVQQVEADSSAASLPMADFLIGYATTENYSAQRVISAGTWFIQEMLNIFEKHAVEEDILTMSSKINALVADRSISTGEKQMPYFRSSLRKKFYFNPPDIDAMNI